MALDKATLITDIVNALEAGASGDKTAVAQALADAIDKYVKTGTVNVTTACGAGAGTGSGTMT